MLQTQTTNRSIVLKARPQGAPSEESTFDMIEGAIPEPQEGQILLRTLYLSLDPYMRGRIGDLPSYASPVMVGDTMIGATVSRVELSNNPDFSPGQLVVGYSGWTEYALSNGTGLKKLDPGIKKPSVMLGALGLTGFTAYMGLLDIGQPKAGDTVVVSAASGAVGSIAGQIAKIKGARVVGIAGGAEKCRYVVEELGFDACIDRNAVNFPMRLAIACPKGIDVYFENVGGAVFNAVLPRLNAGARIPMCGLISHYNDTELPQGPDRLGLLTRTLVTKRIKMQGFIVSEDYGHRYGEFFSQMSEWINNGKIKFREDIVDGLEQAPKAFAGLFKGNNFGKLIVRVAAD